MEDSTDRAATPPAERVDRRTLLRTVAAGGSALGVSRLLGAGPTLGADGEETVVTALVRSEPGEPSALTERSRTVPADWHAAVSRAFALNRRLARVAPTGYLGSSVVPGEYGSGSASISAQVSAPMYDEVADLLGELLDGFRFDLEGIEGLRRDTDATRAVPYRLPEPADGEVPGGVACGANDVTSTFTPTIYRQGESGPSFGTASHAFDDVEDGRGEFLRIPFAGVGSGEAGRVIEDHPREDLVLARPTGEYTPVSRIEGRTSIRVRGQLTRWGLADLIARDEPLATAGAMTRHATGTIQGVDAATRLIDGRLRYGQLRWGKETDMTDGDSGSVNYHETSAGALVAGLNNARTWWPGQSYVWGTAAYRLTDRYGYHF